MIELAIHESLQDIWVETLATPEVDLVRVHLSYQHDSKALAAALHKLGLQGLLDQAVALYSDDTLERTYVTQTDFVLVSKAQL